MSYLILITNGRLEIGYVQLFPTLTGMLMVYHFHKNDKVSVKKRKKKDRKHVLLFENCVWIAHVYRQGSQLHASVWG